MSWTSFPTQKWGGPEWWADHRLGGTSTAEWGPRQEQEAIAGAARSILCGPSLPRPSYCRLQGVAGAVCSAQLPHEACCPVDPCPLPSAGLEQYTVLHTRSDSNRQQAVSSLAADAMPRIMQPAATPAFPAAGCPADSHLDDTFSPSGLGTSDHSLHRACIRRLWAGFLHQVSRREITSEPESSPWEPRAGRGCRALPV